MKHLKPTVFSSIEADAWSRCFTYEDYVECYNRVFPGSSPVAVDVYELLCQAFELQMEHDNKE